MVSLLEVFWKRITERMYSLWSTAASRGHQIEVG